MGKYAGTKGTVGILNVGAGDTKLSFDKSNPVERIRAARIVKDMLRRGYALLVETEVDGKKLFTRAIDFDENVCEYIIADFAPEVAQTEGTHGEEQVTARATTAPTPDAAKPARRKRVKAEQARAVSVARTAGG